MPTRNYRVDQWFANWFILYQLSGAHGKKNFDVHDTGYLLYILNSCNKCKISFYLYIILFEQPSDIETIVSLGNEFYCYSFCNNVFFFINAGQGLFFLGNIGLSIFLSKTDVTTAWVGYRTYNLLGVWIKGGEGFDKKYQISQVGGDVLVRYHIYLVFISV